MSASYQWIKFVEYPLTTPDVSLDVNTPFASYFSDAGHGVRTIIDPLVTTVGVDYFWRQRIAVDSVILFDIEWRYTRPTSTTETLYARTYVEGVPGSWIDQSYFLGTPPTSSLTLTSITGNFLPGTAVVTYQESNSVDGVTSGDIDNDVLGIGYDLRALSIENFRPIEPITNLTDPDNNKVNFKADLYALPKHSTIPAHEDGWAPDTLQFSIAIGNHTSVIDD